MRVTRETPNLTRVTGWRLFNCYLVTEPDGLTLVDTGVAGMARGLVAAAAGVPIRRIVLTHGHTDHAGSTEALRHLLPDVEVLVGRRESRLLAGDRSTDPTESPARVRGGFSPAVPTGLLDDGDRVGSLRAVAAFGHTPGHLAFLDERDRTLLVGDAFSTVGRLTVAGIYRPTFPWPAMATWDRTVAAASARRLAELTPSRLAPGHGRVVHDPAEAIEAALRESDRRAGAIQPLAASRPERRGLPILGQLRCWIRGAASGTPTAFTCRRWASRRATRSPQPNPSPPSAGW